MRCRPILAARGESPAAFEPRCIPRGLRCSSVEFAQYAPSSRLATRAPRRSRCHAGFRHGPLAARGESPAAFEPRPRCGTIAAHGHDHRRLRRAPPAVVRAARRLRALRLLPAAVSDLRAVEPRDRLAPRTDSPAEGGPGGKSGDHAGVRAALRHLPRLHGVPDRVSVRRAVRQAGGGRPAADRAARGAPSGRSPVPANDLLAVPVPRPPALGGAEAVGLPAPGDPAAAARQRTVASASRAAARHGGGGAADNVRWHLVLDARGGSRAGCAPAARGPAARLRAAGLLQRRQCRHGARAGRRGLRRGDSAGTGLLRRADDALRPRERSGGDGAALHRRVRAGAGRRRRDRDQRGRLRVDPEGVRAPAAGRSAVRGARRGVGRQVPRHLGGAGRTGAAGPAASDQDARGLPRRLSPAARAGGERRAAPGAVGGSRAGGVRRAGGRTLLRLGRHLQPRRARGGGRAGTAQGEERGCRPARKPSYRRTRAACCSSAVRWSGRDGRCGRCTWSSWSTLRSGDGSSGFSKTQPTGRRARGRGSAVRRDRTGA